MFTPPPISGAHKIEFGPDKSRILRGIAIIFMITLHNDTLPEFKICVPIFTFLVGYGYSFARSKDIVHGLKRIWNLLSHFWLILFALFLPTAIWFGGYKPSITDMLANMFGLESNLNWYSWYVYFYIYAMIAMIAFSRLIDRYRIIGLISAIVVTSIASIAIHSINGWSANLWLQAIYDCLLCSPVMFVGYAFAHFKIADKIKIPHNPATAAALALVALLMFFLRGVTYASLFDFIIVPVFVTSTVGLFNIIKSPFVTKTLEALGKESMNMWFFHAIFATACTAAAFAPLVDWIQPKFIHIMAVIIISFLASKIFTATYGLLAENR